MAITMLRPKVVWKRRGRSRSSHYSDIANELFTPPILVGGRAVAHPEHEVDAIISAQIAGKSEDEIRALVRRLVADRKTTTILA